MEKYLVCGEITRIHGLGGALVVRHYCDSYEVFEELKYVYLKNKDLYEKKKIKKVSPYKTGVLVSLEGVNDADSAMLLRGKMLYADRDELLKDEDSFFIADLIGLPVKDAKTNELYGILLEVANYGAQDVYVIDRGNGKKAYVPAVAEFIARISLEEGIFISPIEGMIE